MKSIMSSTPSSMLHKTSLTSYFLLLALCLCWELWLCPLRPGGSWLALKVLPLLIPLHGVIQRNAYTMQWAAMLLLVYLAEGVTRGISDNGLSAQLAWLESLLVATSFFSMIFYLRPLKKAAKQRTQLTSSSA